MYLTHLVTSLQFETIDEDELKYYFPEFKPYEGECKFNGCSHIHEPKCAVKAALDGGRLFKPRYDNYITYYKQLKEARKW